MAASTSTAPVITLEPWDPIDVYHPSRFGPDNPPADITAIYLVRYNTARWAWLVCYGDHAVLWWLPAHHVLEFPKLWATGFRAASPYPDSPFWFIGNFEDALEYIYNGIRVDAAHKLEDI